MSISHVNQVRQPTEPSATEPAAGGASNTVVGGVKWFYQRRAATVAAIQWTGENLREVQDFCLPVSPLWNGDSGKASHFAVHLINRRDMALYPSLGRQTSMVSVAIGDWLLRGEDGELAAVSESEFQRDYVAEPLTVAPGDVDPRD